MKTFAARLILVAVLVAAAAAVRHASAMEARLATAQEQLTTTGHTTGETDADLEASAADAARVPILGALFQRPIRQLQAEAAYWRGDYATLAATPATSAGPTADPSLRLLAANAAYRNALLQQRNPQALSKLLDDVLKGYASVLDTAPTLPDAAYNYEFVARLRTALASAKGGPSPAPRSPPMQGEKGEPPEGTKKSDFKVIVPLRPEERQEQTDPGGGAEFKRKG